MKMLPFIAALILAAAPDYQAEVQAAKADFQSYTAQYGHGARYLYLGTVPELDRPRTLTALRFWLPHLSREKVLENQSLTQLPGTSMYRIDIELLGWGQKAWIEVAREYPYSNFEDPLIVRGDWLLFITADTVVSKAYYTLLYSGVGTPKNRTEFLKVFGIVVDDNERTATIIDEGLSGVAYRTRLAVEGPVSAGNWWETYDSRAGFGAADPLEQLNVGKLDFDAQETIVPIRKFSLRTGERGIALVYFLNNKQGQRQEAAPVDIVKDHTQFLNVPEIRTPGHCVACHSAFNGPKENTFREWVKLGIERREKSKQVQQDREQFLLSLQGVIIDRANEDFATFCQEACGVTPTEAQKAYIESAEEYNAPVTLEQAAREVYAKDGDELRRAIAAYSEQIGPQEGVARMASLAHGRSVSRKQFEGDVKKQEPGVFHQAIAALAAWRQK